MNECVLNFGVICTTLPVTHDQLSEDMVSRLAIFVHVCICQDINEDGQPAHATAFQKRSLVHPGAGKYLSPLALILMCHSRRRCQNRSGTLSDLTSWMETAEKSLVSECFEQMPLSTQINLHQAWYDELQNRLSQSYAQLTYGDRLQHSQVERTVV